MFFYYLCGVMKNYHLFLSICVLLFAFTLCCRADDNGSTTKVITLNTGQTIVGTVLFQNDEVIVLQDQDGRRSQYPMSDIQSVSGNTNINEAPKNSASTILSAPQGTMATASNYNTLMLPKTELWVSLNGGACFKAGPNTGGNVGIDLMIGSRQIANHKIFIGGGTGFQAMFTGDATLMFIPLQIGFRIPLYKINADEFVKHSPEFIAQAGYAFGINKGTTGGLKAEVGFLYRYHVSQRAALHIGLTAYMQRASFSSSEYFDKNIDILYTDSNSAHNIFSLNAKIGYSF